MYRREIVACKLLTGIRLVRRRRLINQRRRRRLYSESASRESEPLRNSTDPAPFTDNGHQTACMQAFENLYSP